jgi:hypothetical protein
VQVELCYSKNGKQSNLLKQNFDIESRDDNKHVNLIPETLIYNLVCPKPEN